MEIIEKLKINENSKNVVSVVCCCDENFLPITSVFLESLLEKSSQETFYDVILLTDNVNVPLVVLTFVISHLRLSSEPDTKDPSEF